MRHFTSRALFGILMLLVARDTVAEENSCSNPECRLLQKMKSELLQVSNKMATQKDGSLSWIQVSDALRQASGRRNAVTSMVSSVRKMVLAAVRDTSLANVTLQALDEIVALMGRDVINATLQDHKTEQAIISRSVEAVTECYTTMQSTFTRTGGGINDLRRAADSLNTTHWNCRATQASYNSTDQTKYDAFWVFKTGLSIPAGCHPLPVASDNMRFASCLWKIKFWAKNDWDEYTTKESEYNAAHKDLEEAEKTCSSDQDKWEKGFCDYASLATTTCSTYSSCYSGKVGDYNKNKQDIEVAETSRKAEYKAATKILCFIKVLKETTTDQTKEFNDCDALVVDTSKLDINYMSVSAKASCEKSFAENNDCSTHYASGWPEKAPVDACSECSALAPGGAGGGTGSGF